MAAITFSAWLICTLLPLATHPTKLREGTRQAVALYIACGLDPQKCRLFVQSHIPEHTELTWLLTCITPMGWLERMTQFKEKAGPQRERVGAGVFAYPTLMAADILLYQTDEVPVGDDQRQHVELTRNIAKRFQSPLQRGIRRARASHSTSRGTDHGARRSNDKNVQVSRRPVP